MYLVTVKKEIQKIKVINLQHKPEKRGSSLFFYFDNILITFFSYSKESCKENREKETCSKAEHRTSTYFPKYENDKRTRNGERE